MSKELPLDYIECEYIYTDGTQYIDTGFIPSSETRAVLDIEPTADVVLGSGAAGVFGSRGNGTTSTINYFAIMANKSSQYRSYFGRDTSVLITVSPFQQRVTIDKNSNVVTINGKSASVAWKSWTGLYPIYIFRVNNNGSPTSAQFFGKLYKCQLYNNGILERDYVPCVNNEGIYGLWDKVYGVFVTSADPAYPLTGKWASPKTLAVSLSEIRRRMLAAIAPKGLVAVPDDEIWYTSNDGATVTLYSESSFGANIVSNTYVNGKGVIKFDGDVTGNASMAFAQIKALTSVTLPDSMTSIGDYVFYNCPSLTDVQLSNNILTIGTAAFQYCEKLVTITLPDSLTTINTSAFSRCGFIEITIPINVHTIRDAAFSNSKSLTKIICKPTTPPEGGSGMFSGIASNAQIYVPKGSGAAYKAKQYWSNYASMIVEM